MREEPTIRPADPADLDRLVAMENRVFLTDRISRRSFRHHGASRSAALLVAARGGEIVGYGLVSFRRTSRGARLYSLAVTPEAGRGLGSLLLAACEAEASRRGCDAMRLEVDEGNARAIALYRRAGYGQTGRRESYYEDGANALLFSKALPPSHAARHALKGEQVQAR